MTKEDKLDMIWVNVFSVAYFKFRELFDSDNSSKQEITKADEARNAALSHLNRIEDFEKEIKRNCGE